MITTAETSLSDLKTNYYTTLIAEQQCLVKLYKNIYLSHTIECTSKFTKLQDDLKNSQAELQKLKSSNIKPEIIQNKQDEINTLTNKLNDLLEQVDLQKKLIKQRGDEMNVLELKIAELQEERKTFEDEYEKLRKTLNITGNKMEKDLMKAKVDLAKNLELAKEHINKQKALNMSLKNMTKERNDFSKKHEKMELENVKLIKELENFKDLIKDGGRNDKIIEEMKEKFEEVKITNVNLKDQINEITDELKSKTKQHGEEIKSITKVNSKEITKLRNEKITLEEELFKIKNKLTSLQDKYNEISTNEEGNERLQEVLDENMRLENELLKINKIILSNKQAITKSKQEKEELENEIDLYKANKKRLDLLEKENLKLNTRIDILKESMDVVRNKEEIADKENDELRKENANIKKQLTDLLQDTEKLSTQYYQKAGNDMKDMFEDKMNQYVNKFRYVEQELSALKKNVNNFDNNKMNKNKVKGIKRPIKDDKISSVKSKFTNGQGEDSTPDVIFAGMRQTHGKKHVNSETLKLSNNVSQDVLQDRNLAKKDFSTITDKLEAIDSSQGFINEESNIDGSILIEDISSRSNIKSAKKPTKRKRLNFPGITKRKAGITIKDKIIQEGRLNKATNRNKDNDLPEVVYTPETPKRGLKSVKTVFEAINNNNFFDDLSFAADSPILKKVKKTF